MGCWIPFKHAGQSVGRKNIRAAARILCGLATHTMYRCTVFDADATEMRRSDIRELRVSAMWIAVDMDRDELNERMVAAASAMRYMVPSCALGI